MKIRLVDILNEENPSQRGKFFNYLFPKLVDYFENKYEDSDAVSSSSFMDSQDVYHYKEKLKELKILGKEIQSMGVTLNNLSNVEPTQLNKMMSTYRETFEQYRERANLMIHIGGLFDPFTREYNIPIGLMLELWEKYYEDVYLPSKNTKLRNEMGRDLYYGLNGSFTEDGGNLEVIEFLNSYYSYNNDFYVIIKDNTHNDYILGFDMTWKWKDGGVDLKDLYYLPFKSTKEVKDYIKKDIMNQFYNNIANENKHELIDITVDDAKMLYDIVSKNLNKITQNSIENEDELSTSIGEFLYYETNIDDFSRDDFEYFGREFERLREVINSIGS